MADYKRLFIAAMLAALILQMPLQAAAAHAGTRVCPEGCGNDSIQAAINGAPANSTILVESGRYRENLIAGRPFVLRGLDTGGGRPILAPEKGRIILAAPGTTLQGFIISGPKDSDNADCTLEVVLPASIYLNDIHGNRSICPEAPSSWNSSQAINYQFESRVLRSRLGNYWADYEGPDENSDGIGDMPKVIDSGNIDYYPLMQSVESYRIMGEAETRIELIRSRVGEPFTIALPANPATAFAWSADYNYHLLGLESNRLEKEFEEQLGAGGISVFVFKPLKAGRTTISFVYKRPWENIVADTRTFQVDIAEADRKMERTGGNAGINPPSRT
jgi:predicted secreted protein